MSFLAPPILNIFHKNFRVRRKNLWEGQQCDSTSMVVKLSDVRSKTGKKDKNAFFTWIHRTTIEAEPHCCPSHQFILLTQGPIPEIFAKNIETWGTWKSQVYFELAILNLFLVFSQWKLAWLSYEVSFISALGIVSLESWKRLHSN